MATQPKIRPRPRATTMLSTKPTQPSSHHRSFSASTYPLRVQTLDPRPLQELHNERSYLIHNLQKQGDRATRLLHRYAAVEARLTTIPPSSETKKTKREASLLRAKIADTAQQEQLTLLRLGEIHLELQTRDRWVMLVHQHLLLQQIPPPWLPTSYPISPYPVPSYPVSAPPTPAPGPFPPLGLGLGLGLEEVGCEELQQRQREDTPATEVLSSSPSLASAEDSLFSAVESAASVSVLSPLSPCFMPGEKGWDGVVFFEDIWSSSERVTPKMEGEDVGDGEMGDGGDVEMEVKCCQEVMVMHVEGEDGVENGLEEVEGGERMIKGVDDAEAGHYSDEDEDSEEDRQAWKAKLKRASLCFPMPFRVRERRMSLPYQKSMWSAPSRRDSLPSATG